MLFGRKYLYLNCMHCYWFQKSKSISSSQLPEIGGSINSTVIWTSLNWINRGSGCCPIDNMTPSFQSFDYCLENTHIYQILEVLMKIISENWISEGFIHFYTQPVTIPVRKIESLAPAGGEYGSHLSHFGCRDPTIDFSA